MRTFNKTSFQQNVRCKRGSAAHMTVNANGSFLFNQEAIDKLKLSDNTGVTLYENDGKWYLCEDKNGYRLGIHKAHRTDRQYLNFNHRSLRTEILNSLPEVRKSVILGIKPEAVQVDGIPVKVYELHVKSV